jgi:hypothetical protein
LTRRGAPRTAGGSRLAPVGACSGHAHRRSAASRGAARRALALAFAAVLLLGLVAPLVAALSFDESAPPACCRGRCCCSGAPPSDEPCLRAACHCGGEGRAFLPELGLPDVVLSRRPMLAVPVPEPAPRSSRGDDARSLARAVPHPPPRPDAEVPSAV